MTKTIKIFLIAAGFIGLVLIKVAIGDGLIWALFMIAYFAFATAIWKYKKEPESNDKLDKTD